jgi:ferric-dicitrate binding protein FerR (iron transport regulator)
MKTLLLTLLRITLLVIAAGTSWAQSSPALIRELQGTVEIKRPGSGLWEAAAPGQELEEETLVSTGFKSSALIAIGNSTLEVKPLTRLSLAELRAAAGEVNIRLRTGRVRADVKPPAGGGKINFVLKSPSVTASVRGTAFDFDTVNLNVEEGQVGISGTGGTVVYVGAGETGFLDPLSGWAAPPQETLSAQSAPAPAGTGEGPSAPSSLIPGPVSRSPVDIEIRWPD